MTEEEIQSCGTKKMAKENYTEIQVLKSQIKIIMHLTGLIFLEVTALVIAVVNLIIGSA